MVSFYMGSSLFVLAVLHSRALPMKNVMLFSVQFWVRRPEMERLLFGLLSVNTSCPQPAAVFEFDLLLTVSPNSLRF